MLRRQCLSCWTIRGPFNAKLGEVLRHGKLSSSLGERSVSLDGVIQAPGGPEEDTSGGFAFGGWISPHSDPVVSTVIKKQMNMPFDLLIGRKTFDIWAPFWPKHTDMWSAVNTATKYVAGEFKPKSGRNGTSYPMYSPAGARHELASAPPWKSDCILLLIIARSFLASVSICIYLWRQGRTWYPNVM